MKVKSVVIDGKQYYVMIFHPTQHYSLRVSVARDKYIQTRWLIRYNRWLAKQGKSPFVPVDGEYYEWKSEIVWKMGAA